MTRGQLRALNAAGGAALLFAGSYFFGGALAQGGQEGVSRPANLNQGEHARPATSPLPADAARGRALFERRCAGCHSLDENREGPRLRKTFGRLSGSMEGFAYSRALREANIRWDEKSLEKWLLEPDSLVPGNNMEFSVPRAQERADIIRFLNESAAD